MDNNSSFAQLTVFVTSDVVVLEGSAFSLGFLEIPRYAYNCVKDWSNEAFMSETSSVFELFVLLDVPLPWIDWLCVHCCCYVSIASCG